MRKAAVLVDELILLYTPRCVFRAFFSFPGCLYTDEEGGGELSNPTTGSGHPLG